MGRIFEVRKHTMFARWDRMAKQFARIAKDINMAVKAGGGDVSSNPALRRQVQNARAILMDVDPGNRTLRDIEAPVPPYQYVRVLQQMQEKEQAGDKPAPKKK